MTTKTNATMLTLLTTLLLSLTLSSSTYASAYIIPNPPTIHILNQQPLQQFPMQQQQEPLEIQTTTLHTTVTSYVLYSTITLEAYPWDPHGAKSSGTVFTGLASTFERLGFREVARRAPQRPILRLRL